jgi:tetratricopeptide (TPR) repeat protein
MSKGILRSAGTALKNAVRGAVEMSRGQRSLEEARDKLVRDARKLARQFHGDSKDESGYWHAESVKLVEEGRKAYNNKHYEKAEGLFRQAITHDASHAWAHTYLGHTLYKLGRTEEAVTAWKHAVKADPSSQAAERAQEKLDRVSQAAHQTAEQLMSNYRGR